MSTTNPLEIGILCGGSLSLLLALFHMGFSRVFGWEEAFSGIGVLNRRIVTTLHVAVILFFLIFALLSFAHTEVLSRGEGLAGATVGCYSAFWLWRAVWQVLYFRPSRLRPGRGLLALHGVLIGVFAILALVYLAPLAARLAG